MVGVCGVRATANVEVATCSATLTREQHLCMVFLSVSQVAEGNGPVNALAKALFRALLPQFPSLENVVLSDYKARNHTLFASQVSNGIRETFANITLRSAASRVGCDESLQKWLCRIRHPALVALTWFWLYLRYTVTVAGSKHHVLCDTCYPLWPITPRKTRYAFWIRKVRHGPTPEF